MRAAARAAPVARPGRGGTRRTDELADRAASRRGNSSARAAPGGLSRNLQLALGLLAPAALLLDDLVAAAPVNIDDAFISFRYARNLARGMGLVYNAGERIEGYTNFLETPILAAGIKLGVEPTVTAKVVGGMAALGALAVVWRLSERLVPSSWVPSIATWLLASSMVFAGYAPVRISAICPLWRTMPPMSWTSKWRIFSARFPASRQTAKDSMSRSSTVAPRSSFSLELGGLRAQLGVGQCGRCGARGR